ncbi:MAG: hypothetical protein VB050_17895 [Geobacteraceae bacterium]|nr:hypothetical protein [Geobacteraceae bacterium]
MKTFALLAPDAFFFKVKKQPGPIRARLKSSAGHKMPSAFILDRCGPVYENMNTLFTGKKPRRF